MSSKIVALPVLAAGFFCAGLSAHNANAAAILATSAAGINNSGGSGGVGTHYHWGPGSEAQVNYSFGEEGRGVAEFDLSSLSTPLGSAELSFTVSGFKDIFYTPTPFLGEISLLGYVGNNAISLSDFQSISTGTIASFVASSLSIGDVLTYDVTTLVAAQAGGSLGIKWDPIGASPQFSAITFDQITITTSDVPEPATLALLGLGAAGLGAMRRKKRPA